MRALICLDGYRVGEMLASVQAMLTPQAEWLVLYVSDTGPLEEAGRAMGGLLGRGPGRERATRQMWRTAEQAEAEARATATEWLRKAGRAAELIFLRGRPEHEILRVAEERQADVIVLPGDERGLPGHHAGPGPRPLNPVARFVVDHSSSDVLLLRRYAETE